MTFVQEQSSKLKMGWWATLLVFVSKQNKAGYDMIQSCVGSPDLRIGFCYIFGEMLMEIGLLAAQSADSLSGETGRPTAGPHRLPAPAFRLRGAAVRIAPQLGQIAPHKLCFQGESHLPEEFAQCELPPNV